MENSNPPPASPAPATPSMPVTPADPRAGRAWSMWCHLSGLSGFIIPVPFVNIIAPLILWQMKRQELPEVDMHGKEALNFQISVVIYLIVGTIAMFVGMFACGLGLLLIPVLVVIGLGSVVLSIIAGIKANEGVAYRYPFTLRLIS